MEEPNNNNLNLEEPISCKKEEHFNQQFVYFKFSDKIDEILQCISCMQEDPQVDKKIIIDQILKFPITKIKNFPPQKNQKDSAEIRRILEKFTKEKIEQFKNQVKDQIVEYYKKINNDLNLALQQSQKDVIQQFDNILEFTDISEFYNIESLKNALKWFQNKKINIQQLFEQQLIMKKEFECEQKCKTVLNLELKQKEILNQIENLKEQLNKKVDIFQEKITINPELIKNFQNQEINYNSTILQQQEINNQQQVQFYNYEQDAEIEIKNNSKRIEIDNKTIKNVIKVCSACGAACGVSRIVEGQIFADFWEDDKTILNLVFNYKEKSFEVYDDQRKGHIKNVIDQNKIKGEQVVLGIRFWQSHCNKIDLSIIDVRAH